MTMQYKILVVDDELGMCKSLCETFESDGFLASYTSNPLNVDNILKKENIDLIIMDIKMPNIGGMDLLKIIKEKDPSIPIIMITGYPSIESAVESMKYGASNFFSKPIDIDKLLNEISQLLKSKSRKKDNSISVNKIIITRNIIMKKILKEVEKAAITDVPVLITGESGTGKELIANYIQQLSKRANHPFIKVNCAALPDSLLENELFGHEKGAFTDAHHEKKGKFELADKGTIFFDEIGDMRIKTQSKILRVLQEKEFERVGGIKTIQVDIRIIAATNKNIKKLIEEEEFRDDLYYRLSVITINMIPLRERKDDILLLCDHFINNFNMIYDKNIKTISDEVKDFFLKHNWPGNIRELKNCIERAIIFCEGDLICPNDLPTQYSELLEDFVIEDYNVVFSNLNKEIILDALAKTKGSKHKAAELLKINRRTLYNRMKKLGL